MDIYVTTVIRETKRKQAGHIFRIDWDSQRIVEKIPVISTSGEDLGERGGRRGGRGICHWGDSIVVANYDSLSFYDRDLGFRKTVSHPMFCALHEICSSNEGIWVTSTGCEALLLFDPESEKIIYEWYATEIDALHGEPLNVPQLKIDRSADHRNRIVAGADTLTHLNCVYRYKDNTYVTFSHQAAIVQVLPELKVCVHAPEMKNPHNGYRLDDNRFIINDTWNQKIRFFDVESGAETGCVDLNDLPIEIQCEANRLRGLIKVAKPGWLRGMAILNERRILVGVSPSTVVEIDIQSNEVIKQLHLSDDIRNSIHGIELGNPA